MWKGGVAREEALCSLCGEHQLCPNQWLFLTAVAVLFLLSSWFQGPRMGLEIVFCLFQPHLLSVQCPVQNWHQNSPCFFALSQVIASGFALLGGEVLSGQSTRGYVCVPWMSRCAAVMGFNLLRSSHFLEMAQAGFQHLIP